MGENLNYDEIKVAGFMLRGEKARAFTVQGDEDDKSTILTWMKRSKLSIAFKKTCMILLWAFALTSSCVGVMLFGSSAETNSIITGLICFISGAGCIMVSMIIISIINYIHSNAKNRYGIALKRCIANARAQGLSPKGTTICVCSDLSIGQKQKRR